MQGYDLSYANSPEFWYSDVVLNHPVERVISSGVYGRVWRSRERGVPVAVKTAICHPGDEPAADYIRERAILETLRHSAIVPVRATYPYIVFDYIPYTLKDTHVRDVNGTIHQIRDALVYAHSRGICHRDLKPSNILVDGTGKVYVADWGMGLVLPRPHVEPRTPEVVTLWYRAPEVLVGTGYYGFEMDIWALGCIWYELQVHRPLFYGETAMQILKLISKTIGPVGGYTLPVTRNWKSRVSNPEEIEPMLTLDPRQRRF